MYDFGMKQDIGKCWLYARDCLDYKDQTFQKSVLRFSPSNYTKPQSFPDICTHIDWLEKIEANLINCSLNTKENCLEKCYWTTPNFISQNKGCLNLEKIEKNVLYEIDDVNLCH